MGVVGEVDGGQTTLNAEAERLGRGEAGVYYRVAVERPSDDGPAVVRSLELTVGPVDYEDRHWDYGDFVFASGWAAPAEVEDWLRDRKGEIALRPSALPIVLPDLPEAGTWERLPSRSRRDDPPLDWPYRRVAFTCANRAQQTARRRFLVGSRAPSFPTFDHAAEAFFHLRTLTGARPQSFEALVIRQQDEGVRIQAVEFSAISVKVTLDAPQPVAYSRGRDVLVDAGPSAQGTPQWVRIDSQGRESVTEFGLRDGIPEEWWVVVTDGSHRWLDFRHGGAQSQPPDVEFSRAGLDPTEVVKSLIYEGEGPKLEFKREVPATPDGRRKLARTMAAFANGEGGTLLFGIDPDEVTIAGIEGDYRIERDRLTNIAKDFVVPPIDVLTERYETEAGLVVGMEIPPGRERPYGIDPKAPCYYVRRGASTVPATSGDIRWLVLDNLGARVARRGAW